MAWRGTGTGGDLKGEGDSYVQCTECRQIWGCQRAFKRCCKLLVPPSNFFYIQTFLGWIKNYLRLIFYHITKHKKVGLNLEHALVESHNNVCLRGRSEMTSPYEGVGGLSKG